MYKSKHTGETIDKSIDRMQYVTNPNLLDNWYFGNPVDQMGGWLVPPGVHYYTLSWEFVGVTDKYYPVLLRRDAANNYDCEIEVNGTRYVVAGSLAVRGYTSAGYGIDRWCGSSLASITLESDGVLFVKRGNGTPVVNTPLEKERFVNGYYTISVCYYVDNKLELSKDTFYLTVGNTIDTNNINVGGLWYMDFHANSQEISNGIYELRFYNPSGAIGDSCKLVAIKLELGSQQTLAHQDEDGNWVLNEIPNYAEELAKCQRYQLKLIYGTSQNYAPIGFGFANNTTSIRILIPTPATMRASPTLSYLSGSISGLTILCDGKQLIPESVNTVNVLPYGVALMFTVSDATSSAPCVLRATSAYCILDANL